MWKWCFWAMAILGALGLLLMIFWLPGTPNEEGLPDLPGTEIAKAAVAKPDAAASSDDAGQELSMMKMVFLHPVIWMLGLANFTINAVRALVADWGPTMLQEAKHLNSSEAGTVIMLFEFAGIVGMLFSGWATDRLFGGRAPRLCMFMMIATAGLFAAFWFLPSGIAAAAALCAAGFCLYGPQALTGVTAANTSTKRFAGTSIGFTSLFSYVGVSVAGKVFGHLAHSSGSWRLPLLVTVGVATAGAVFFLCLWFAKANAYDSEKAK
jgi:OPA family glycerol-3-phosphate transporter-like MFS transporter/OPA family sugar phosphate sensor protein UhpC-like MFS transporter